MLSTEGRGPHRNPIVGGCACGEVQTKNGCLAEHKHHNLSVNSIASMNSFTYNSQTEREHSQQDPAMFLLGRMEKKGQVPIQISTRIRSINK